MARKKYTAKSYSEKIEQLSGGEYTVLGHYTKSANKILVRHNPCGTEFEIIAGALITLLDHNRHPCRHCTIESRKIDKNKFLNRLKELYGVEYELVSDYTGYTEHVTLRHTVCGHLWQVIPELLIGRGKSCPYCLDRGGRVNTQMAQERLDKTCNKRFELIAYTFMNSPVELKDRASGETFNAPSLKAVIEKGEKYREKVAYQQQRAKEQIRVCEHRKAVEKNNPDFSFGWITAHKAHLVCNKCGDSFDYVFHSDKIGTVKCPREKNTTPKKGTQGYVEYELKRLGGEYQLLSSYQKSAIKAHFLHKTCGTDFWALPARVLNDLRHHPEKHSCCPTCQGKKGRKKTKTEYQEELNAKVGGSLTILSEYVDEKTPILVRHNCGHEYMVTPKTLNGRSSLAYCPACSDGTKSTGALTIEHFLKRHKISYRKEYCFPDLKDRGPLRFDFAIFQRDKLKLLIEYDGQQHFKSVEIFGGEEALATLQKHDKMKDEYCQHKHIPLERINYLEEANIESIMSSILSRWLQPAA